MSPESLFRYRIVSAVEVLSAQGHGRTAAVRLLAEQVHTAPDGSPRPLSEATIWRWLRAYRSHGVDGLERQKRAHVEDSLVLPDPFIDFLVAEREQDRDASIPELIRRARETNIIHPGQKIDRTTCWRAMKRLGLATKARKIPVDADTRRFAYPEPMQMLLLDFVHFRAGFDPALKRCAVYVIDDATRRILAARVTTSENADTVLEVLAEVLRRYGRFDRVYWDHGSAFTAHDIDQSLAKLHIPPILGRVGYPEGRGKIERFNRSVRARLLRGLRRPDVDPDCGSLTLRVRHDAFEIYNGLPHESLDGRSPNERWAASSRELREVDEDRLVKAFSVVESRLVSSDHVVSYGGRPWEVPAGLAGEKIEIHRRPLEGHALYIEHRGAFLRLHPVDLAHNATSRRATSPPASKKEEAPHQAPKTASMMAFDKAVSPMTGPDGGYPASPKTKE